MPSLRPCRALPTPLPIWFCFCCALTGHAQQRLMITKAPSWPSCTAARAAVGLLGTLYAGRVASVFALWAVLLLPSKQNPHVNLIYL